MFSERFEEEVTLEIDRLKKVMSVCEMKIKNLLFLAGEALPQEPVKLSKRAYKKRGKDKPVDDASEPDSGSNGHSKPAGRAIKSNTPEAIRKREYQRRWREAKANAGIGAGGKIGTFNNKKISTIGKRKYTRHNNSKPTSRNAVDNDTANKFTLNREFNIDERDLRLIMSYLTSWRGLGRLEFEEVKVMERFHGLNTQNLSDQDKLCLRDVFYAARERVMGKAIAASVVK